MLLKYCKDSAATPEAAAFVYIFLSEYAPIFPFLNKDMEYTNINLFPVFASRLPDPKRKDIDKILNKYNMSEYDQFTLLQKNHGRLPIDTLEFI